MWWGIRAPSCSNPCVKIPNGPEQTERTELAGTLSGGESRHPKTDTNLSLPIPLIQQPFLAVAQQLLVPIRKATIHNKIICSYRVAIGVRVFQVSK